MIKYRNRFLSVVALLGFFILFACSMMLAIWNEYGGHNLHIAIVKYIRAHDGSWPQSWEDLEPYHIDPVFGVESTIFVRQFWGVAWDIDPQKVVQKREWPSNTKPTSVVFNISLVEDPSSIKNWDLGETIIDYYIKRVE